MSRRGRWKQRSSLTILNWVANICTGERGVVGGGWGEDGWREKTFTVYSKEKGKKELKQEFLERCLCFWRCSNSMKTCMIKLCWFLRTLIVWRFKLDLTCAMRAGTWEEVSWRSVSEETTLVMGGGVKGLVEGRGRAWKHGGAVLVGLRWLPSHLLHWASFSLSERRVEEHGCQKGIRKMPYIWKVVGFSFVLFLICSFCNFHYI
jgi:hypothetical protein